jgi:curved DNA-binding protein CbpA
MTKKLYEILSVNENATVNEIRKQYYKLALIYHPDKNSAPNAKQHFNEINQAYSILGDQQKRQLYDGGCEISKIESKLNESPKEYTNGSFADFSNNNSEHFKKENLPEFFKSPIIRNLPSHFPKMALLFAIAAIIVNSVIATVTAVSPLTIASSMLVIFLLTVAVFALRKFIIPKLNSNNSCEDKPPTQDDGKVVSPVNGSYLKVTKSMPVKGVKQESEVVDHFNSVLKPKKENILIEEVDIINTAYIGKPVNG